MKFILKADCEFFAENLDDAFEQISMHFATLAGEDDDICLDFTGSIEIYKIGVNS
ncbi:MAG: hypothetical protein PHG08_00060 [Bacilli bacterium]|nr:hypothetical protein [Bacilli bacterium]